ncbi:MAG TPA: tetratricopeptide repeat protein [Thermoanaerobaculia bacterium]|nr:tetratricopeptide repeat protein [Thermoanaerobaculia bacterium]
MTKDDVFDALLESELAPEPPCEAVGKTLPFVRAAARVSVEDIYRLSQDAEKPAELILKAARAGADELAAAIRSLDGKPYRGFALLYAAQKADQLVAEDPNKALALARLLSEEAATLQAANSRERISTPAPRQAVQAEAALLESQALLQKGEAERARDAVRPARDLFRESGDLGFGVALCDYHEGTAATFAKVYSEAERLLRSALTVFEEFGQEHLSGRAYAGLGTLFVQQGQFELALEYFDAALLAFESESDTGSKRTTMLLNNRATALMRLGRLDEARSTFAKALNFGRRHNHASHLFFIRTGLAELDFRRGEYRRALRAFTEIVREASPLASKAELLLSRLYAAECQARIGAYSSMAVEIEALRKERQGHPFAPSPALGELFMSLDQGTIDADLIAHVREYLQDEESGVKRPYRPLRLVG